MTPEGYRKLLILASDYDQYSSLYWNSDLEFFINCNDLFFWGCADLEPILDSDLEFLEACWKETELFGSELYCARKRKLRPQGAYYKHMTPEIAKLFDACGPEREVGFGNPLSNTPKAA